MTEDTPPAKEPLFNAPWPSLALVAILIAAYGWQAAQPPSYVEAHALSAPAVRAGQWQVLFSHLFLHAGFAHLAMNAGAALAFGPPVARRFGTGGGGAILLAIFFLICGALSGLGFLALSMANSASAIGASGAVSGLWGAASRMLGRGPGTGLWPLTSGAVLKQAAAFAGVNVLIGALGGFGGLAIAWEAHLAGYAAGAILIGLFPAERR